MTSDEAIDQAIQAHQAGRAAQAEALCRQALALEPEHPEALYFLGVLASERGDLNAAGELLERAIAADDQMPESRYALGRLRQVQGRHGDAEKHYRAAAALDDTLADPHARLGELMALHGRWPEAESSLRSAAALNPRDADVQHKWATALRRLGRAPESVEAYRRAVALKPGDIEMEYHFGTALLESGRAAEAREQFRRTFAAAHKDPPVLAKLGVTLTPIVPNEAIEALRSASARMPADAHVTNDLGFALAQVNRMDDAVAAFREAVRRQPAFAAAHSNLANALQALGCIEEAIASVREAIRLNPSAAEAHHTLANFLRASGRIVEAIAEYRQSITLAPHYREAYDNFLYSLYFSPNHDAAAIVTEHRRWGQMISAAGAPPAPHQNDRDPGRRLRIGYVSPDFYDHIAGVWIQQLLMHHDRSQVELFCYSATLVETPATERFKRLAGPGWRTIVGLNDDQAAALIRRDGIDVLIDCAVHTGGNRLPVFARKPAPVQVTHIGYPGTTGLSQIDYRISDAELDPPGRSEAFSTAEAPFRLPGGFFLYTQTEPPPPPGPLPALSRGHITFGCMNNPGKVTEPAIELFARVLKRIPSSRLLMMLRDVPTLRDERRSQLASHGVSADRIDFVPPGPLRHFRAAHQNVDIALDPIPCNGGITSCDALLMGVPIVSLSGDTPPSRAGASLLARVGLRHLAVEDKETYVETAARLAADTAALAQLRAELPQRTLGSTIFNSANHTRELEVAYREMWQKWCAAGDNR
jgi:predicted O-linked N-acetylglucosamine transferase (SPINDLY family)